MDNAFDSDLQKWWNYLTDDQRQRLRAATDQHDLAPDSTKLLIDTRCPVGPVGVKWESNLEYRWSWPEPVLEFVRAR